MRQWIRLHLSFANVVSLVALFVALGGTTYAATGGNFILGKSNSAGAPTQLSSGASSALSVTSTATNGGRAIGGFSSSGQGVYGHSTRNAGIVGESERFDGVFGVSNDQDSAGVSGHGDGGGYGVFATGGNTLFHTAAIHGQSIAGNAVEGYSSRGFVSGVYGQDNHVNGSGVTGHSTNGAAVTGNSSNGWAVQALGDTTQDREAGGLVKAMAYVNPRSTVGDFIERCFNSQMPTGQATKGDCGMTYTKRDLPGVGTIDFGFQVTDRFILSQAQSQQGGWYTTVSPANAGTVSVMGSQEGVGSRFVPFFIVVF